MFRRATAAAIAAVAALTGAAATAVLVARGPVDAEPATTPEEAIGRFADCPTLALDVTGLVCLHATIYDGDLKLGGTEAHIDDPIVISAAVGIDANTQAVIALPEDSPVPPGTPLEALLGSLLACTQACGRGVPISGGVRWPARLDPCWPSTCSASCASRPSRPSAPRGQRWPRRWPQPARLPGR